VIYVVQSHYVRYAMHYVSSKHCSHALNHGTYVQFTALLTKQRLRTKSQKNVDLTQLTTEQTQKEPN